MKKTKMRLFLCFLEVKKNIQEMLTYFTTFRGFDGTLLQVIDDLESEAHFFGQGFIRRKLAIQKQTFLF